MNTSEHPSAAYRTIIGSHPVLKPQGVGDRGSAGGIRGGCGSTTGRSTDEATSPCSTIHANDHHLRFATSIHAFRPDLLGFLLLSSFLDPRNVVGAKRFIYLRLEDQHSNAHTTWYFTKCTNWLQPGWFIRLFYKRDTNKASHFRDQIFNKD